MKTRLQNEVEVKNSIKNKVDRLGEILATIKPLQAEADEIKKNLYSLGENTYEGNFYKAIVSKSVSHEYDKSKLYKKLGSERFIEISKPSVTELKKYVSEADLQKYIVNTFETLKVTVKEVKNGK